MATAANLLSTSRWVAPMMFDNRVLSRSSVVITALITIWPQSLCNVLDSVASPREEGAVAHVVLSFIKRNHFEEVFLPVLRSGVRPAQVLALRQARRRCMCCTTDLVLREVLRAAAPL